MPATAATRTYIAIRRPGGKITHAAGADNAPQCGYQAPNSVPWPVVDENTNCPKCLLRVDPFERGRRDGQAHQRAKREAGWLPRPGARIPGYDPAYLGFPEYFRGFGTGRGDDVDEHLASLPAIEEPHPRIKRDRERYRRRGY